MLTKIKVLESLNEMPETFALDELIDKLILLQKVDKGLEESAKGVITPDNELDTKMKKWLD